MESLRILLVEDNEGDARLIREYLAAAEGFESSVEVADSVAEAHQLLSKQAFDAILLDLGLPDMAGLDTLAAIDAAADDVPILVLTGLEDGDLAVRAVHQGAQDYLVKGKINSDALNRSVRYSRERKRTQVELERKIVALDSAHAQLEQSYLRLKETLDQAVRALSTITEAHDPYTAGHQLRVTRLACAIADQLDLDEGRTAGLRMAALVHDIGKVAVPADILNKPSRLSDPELRIVRQHALASYDVLREVAFPWPVADIVIQHHERMDGSGYPHGLLGETLLLEAKILAVADVVEASLSHRPYRPANSIETTRNELMSESGKLYDKSVVDACLRLLDDGFQLDEDPSN